MGSPVVAAVDEQRPSRIPPMNTMRLKSAVKSERTVNAPQFPKQKLWAQGMPA
jgi:hypothetical protein